MELNLKDTLIAFTDKFCYYNLRKTGGKYYWKLHGSKYNGNRILFNTVNDALDNMNKRSSNTVFVLNGRLIRYP